MFNFSIFISIMITLLLSGCTHTVSLGKNRTSICTVNASRSLDFTGGKFIDEIVVAADENGNAIFSAKEEKDSRLIITYLSPSDQKEVLSMLRNSLEFANTANREKAEAQKTLGIWRKQTSEYGWPTDLAMRFYASSPGEIWNTSFEVCRMMPAEFRTSPKDQYRSL